MRYFIELAYDGTNYHGWQIQPNGISVQETVQSALSTVLRQPIEIVGAGRTEPKRGAASWPRPVFRFRAGRVLL